MFAFLMVSLLSEPITHSLPIGIWQGTDQNGIHAQLEVLPEGQASLQIGKDGSSVNSTIITFYFEAGPDADSLDWVVLDRSGKEIRRIKTRFSLAEASLAIALKQDLNARPESTEPGKGVQVFKFRKK